MRQRKPIPHRGANNRECTGLSCVYVRAKGTKSNPCCNERSELRPLVPEVRQQRSRAGQSKTQHTPPDQDTNTDYGILSAAGGAASGVHQAGRQVYICTGPVLRMSPMMRAAVRITRSRQPRRTAGRPT